MSSKYGGGGGTPTWWQVGDIGGAGVSLWDDVINEWYTYRIIEVHFPVYIWKYPQKYKYGTFIVSKIDIFNYYYINIGNKRHLIVPISLN